MADERIIEELIEESDKLKSLVREAMEQVGYMMCSGDNVCKKWLEKAKEILNLK